MTPPTAAEKLACAEREAKMRERVYPRWVADARMSQATADRSIATGFAHDGGPDA